MSLIRWSPLWDSFEDFESLFEGMPSRVLRPHNMMPAADVYETKDAVVAEIPLAGVDPDKVEISVQDNILTVKGDMERKTEVEDKNYCRREVRRGSFYRSLPLPAAVDGAKASAVSENGMIKISVPKITDEKPKKIKVEVKKK